jgi:hypothetical protein
LPRRPWFVFQHLQQQQPLGALKRPLPGQHFVKNHSQAVHVGPRVDGGRVAQNLFGRHVGRSAQQTTIGGHRRLAAVVPLGQAEIGDMRPAGQVQNDIRRLQITMDDAVLVRVLYRLGQFRHQRGGDPYIESLALQTLLERFPLDVFGHQKTDAVIRMARIIQGHDRRMRQRCRAACLAQKSTDIVAAGESTGALDLDRHHSIQFHVARSEHVTK